MVDYNYSTIIVSGDSAALETLVNVASALGESVAVVDSEENFQAIFSPDVRCVVLEVNLPQSCCLGIIRQLGHYDYRGALIFSAGPATDLDALYMARRLATGFGIAVVDTLVKPIGAEQMLETMIEAIDPAVVKRLRADILGPAACAPARKNYRCSGSC